MARALALGARGREFKSLSPDLNNLNAPVAQMPMYYVYALATRNKDRIYVGLACDLEARLKEHNSGRTKSTKHYRPWSIFYSEEVESRIIAREREKELKAGYGKEFLKKILDNRPCSSVG